MPIAMCPICDGDLLVRGRPSLGQRVVCPRCDAKLFIVWQDPLELDWRFYDLDEEDGSLDTTPDRLDRTR